MRVLPEEPRLAAAWKFAVRLTPPEEVVEANCVCDTPSVVCLGQLTLDC